MLTSWSEVSTPAELSMKSVFTSPPPSAYSTLASCVSPRFPPSPSRSTGARSTAEISSSGGSAVTPAARPSTARACGETGTDLAVRGHTPPPSEISDRS